jgi:hypothetical protein
MEGKEVNSWEYKQGILWHFAEMLPSGNLLVIPNDGGYQTSYNSDKNLIELDWNSKLVWKNPARAHHDAERLANGNTLAVCHDRAQHPELCKGTVIYDYLQEIKTTDEPDEEIVWEWHITSHIDELKSLNHVIMPRALVDWPHINTVETLPDTPLGRKDERFREGNILLSGRSIHTIFIVDRESEEVVWSWGPDEILGQHEPTMLEDGNILLFDNGRGPDKNGLECRGDSRALEIEPASGKVVWQYRADPITDFWSPVGSGAQRLPNGNTLICAMNWEQTGRVFKVTPGGEIVWEYWDPEGCPFYRSRRYAPDLVQGLMNKK